MKKFVSIIALIIIASMFMATPISAIEDYERNYGQDTIKANKLTKAPTLDGKVSVEEYGAISNAKTEPNAWMNNNPLGGTNVWDDSYFTVSKLDPRKDAEWAYLKDRTMKKLDTWFAYDDKYIYIAYSHLSGVWDTDADEDTIAGNAYNEYYFRSNYVMRVGFNMSNAYDLIQMEFSMPTFTNGVATLQPTTPATSGQGGLKCSITQGMAGNKYNSGVALESCADVIEGAVMSKYYMDGTPFEGSVNSKKGQFIECIEIVLDKEALLKAYNDEMMADLSELPNGMYFFFAGRHYSWADKEQTKVGYEGQTMWFGAAMSEKDQDDYGLGFTYYPDIVVFGDKLNVTVATTAPTTTAPTTTAPVTTAPVTTAPADDVTTAAPAVTTAAPEAEGGCGGTVTVAGLALVAALGTCAVFVEKKRK